MSISTKLDIVGKEQCILPKITVAVAYADARRRSSISQYYATTKEYVYRYAGSGSMLTDAR
ncbi:MAG: hypothetical protein Phog2KO_41810 [Phototrophicaceae bacterium]